MTPVNFFDQFETKEQYEQWIRDARARGRRERIRRRVMTGVGIVAAALAIVGLLIAVNVATAAPLPEPDAKSGFQRGLREPDAAPQKGITLRQAQEACEQHGGHWLVEEDVPEFPNGKIIGCLFLVPKAAK